MQSATKSDNLKLLKLLGYIWKTKEKKMHFGRGGESCDLKFYVDGAFAVHANAKSHKGLVVEYGGSCVLA